MTLDEQITEIAEITVKGMHGAVWPIDMPNIKTACYAAIRAFCDREPSEGMMTAGDNAILEGLVRAASGFLPPKHATHASHEVYCAMMAQAKEEL